MHIELILVQSDPRNTFIISFPHLMKGGERKLLLERSLMNVKLDLHVPIICMTYAPLSYLISYG